MNEFPGDALPKMDAELRRDLWPAMQARIRSARRFSRFDWALAAAAAAWVTFFPQSVIALLFHL